MTLLHLALDQIDETQLQRLIDGRASEKRDIEYKRDTYGKADRDYGEYLADISSFANTIGGDIIIGMNAKAGVPTGFAPRQTDPDAEILRLEDVARSGLQPRIFGLAIREIPIATGGFVLVVRIPRSYNQPHRIVRQGTGHHRFYARSSAGKYEPNVDELRLLFGRAPQLADRIRDFRIDRIAKITANDAPVPLLDAHALTLHVIPFSAFDTRLPLPLDPRDRLYSAFPPLLSSQPSNFRINVDGLLTLSNSERDTKQQRAYVQVFHTGIVEAVASSFLQGDRTPQRPGRLTAPRTEACIVKYSHIYLRALLTLGCAPPFALLVSLIGVKGVPYSFTMGSSVFEDEAGMLDRDQLHFQEVIIEDVQPDPYEYAKRLRALLDQTANAAGRAATPSFEGSGKFLLKVDW
jgi:hypothetical protein